MDGLGNFSAGQGNWLARALVSGRMSTLPKWRFSTANQTMFVAKFQEISE